MAEAREKHYQYLGRVAALQCFIGTMIFLHTFTTPVLHSHTTGVVQVTPSSVLVHNSTWDPSAPVDGPSVFMGMLGSCYRESNDDPLNCTFRSALHPHYIVDKLPGFGHLLRPLGMIAVFMASGFASLGTGAVGLGALSLRSYLTKMTALLDDRRFYNGAAFLYILGYLGFSISWLFTFIYLRKAKNDFNLSIDQQQNAPAQLMATMGDGSTLFWVVSALFHGPLWFFLALLKYKATPLPTPTEDETPPAADAPDPPPEAPAQEATFNAHSGIFTIPVAPQPAAQAAT